MKNLFSVAICFLLFSQNGLSQTEPQLIKYTRYIKDNPDEDLWKISEEEFTHNEFGDTSIIVRRIFNSDGTLDFLRGYFYDYDENQLLKKLRNRRYNESVDLWITNSWYEYNYDDNGCLLEEKLVPNFGEGVRSKIIYEHDDECRMVSTMVLERLDISDPFYIYSLKTRDYHPDGFSYDEEEYSKYTIGDSLYLRSLSKRIFNEKGKIVEKSWKLFGENSIQSDSFKYTYEYDNYDNLILKKLYSIPQGTLEWVLHSERNYYLEYDANGFVKENHEEYLSHNTGTPTIIEHLGKTVYLKNSCKGIQEEIFTISGESGNEIKEEFVYQGINECLDLDQIDLKITISPNPSAGNIKIASPIFQTGNTDVLVFATDGKVLLQKNEISRGETSSIDLTSLQNGIYILQLQNGKHFVNEKIVITKY